MARGNRFWWLHFRVAVQYHALWFVWGKGLDSWVLRIELPGQAKVIDE